MIHRHEQDRDVPRPVGNACGGGGDEEGFLSGGGGGESGEGGEDVVGGCRADCDFGAHAIDADAGNYDVSSAAVEGKGSFAVFGDGDVAFGDCEVGVNGGLGDAFFEKEGCEFGRGADDL